MVGGFEVNCDEDAHGVKLYYTADDRVHGQGLNNGSSNS